MPKTAVPAALIENRLIRRLIKLGDELGLDRREFVIFGSAAALLAHGLRRRIRDLDIVVRGTAWETVSRHGFPAIGPISGAPMALFWGSLIQFSAEWISADWDTDDLIDRAQIIQGLPFARLTDVLAYKQQLDRPKDRLDTGTLLGLLRQRAEPADSPHPMPQGDRRVREFTGRTVPSNCCMRMEACSCSALSSYSYASWLGRL